jgi:hypothetical protein
MIFSSRAGAQESYSRAQIRFCFPGKHSQAQAPLAPGSPIFDVADLTEMHMISRGSSSANMVATGAVWNAVKPDSDCHGTQAFPERLRASPNRRAWPTCPSLT